MMHEVILSKIVCHPLEDAESLRSTYLRTWDFGWQKRGIFRFFIFFDLRANVFLCILTYNKEREYLRTCNSIRCKNQCLKKMTEGEWINAKTVSHC